MAGCDRYSAMVTLVRRERERGGGGGDEEGKGKRKDGEVTYHCA